MYIVTLFAVMERSWRRYFMALLVVILILSLTNAQDYKGQGFKLTSIKSSFDVLETTSKMKTLIECCSFCLAKSPPCEGVQFDMEKTSCSSLANILPSDSGTSSAYIMVPLSSRNKAKVLLVSGNERNMELVNLATKQSFIYEFPIQWAQGGPISANMYYFCSYYEDLFCVTLNIDTLETEFTAVTTQFQRRAVGRLIGIFRFSSANTFYNANPFKRYDHQTRRATSYLVDWKFHILTNYFVD